MQVDLVDDLWARVFAQCPAHVLSIGQSVSRRWSRVSREAGVATALAKLWFPSFKVDDYCLGVARMLREVWLTLATAQGTRLTSGRMTGAKREVQLLRTESFRSPSGVDGER